MKSKPSLRSSLEILTVILEQEEHSKNVTLGTMVWNRKNAVNGCLSMMNEAFMGTHNSRRPSLSAAHGSVFVESPVTK